MKTDVHGSHRIGRRALHSDSCTAAADESSGPTNQGSANLGLIPLTAALPGRL